jgi:predicted MPP superfamily phosphohydrolase
MKDRKFKLLVFLLTLALLTTLAYTNALETVTDPVQRPLPSLPEPVVQEGQLPVLVKSTTKPDNIEAKIWSKYDESVISLDGEPTLTGDTWTLIFTIPEIRTGLYNLNLVYNENEKLVNATQKKSVWVMEEWPEEITISHISDIHQPYGAKNFTNYIYEQNLLNPDMILVTGDVVDVETIRSAWENLQSTMELSNVPIFLLPGNHDHTDGAKFYKQYGGLTNYTVTIGDFFIVALNSHGGGYINIDEIQWAERVLKENPEKVKIMAFHHPLLSSEYEDDQGTVTGGEVSGSWEDIEELEELMYFTWSQNIDHAEEILRVITENDVEIILAGHVHRDMIYILNNAHSFITTTTIGGGTSQNRGYRHITVYSNGTYQLDEYGEKNKFNPPNSIPLDQIEYYYKKENDGTQNAVSASIVNNLKMPLEDVEIEFILDDNIDPASYSFYPEEPQSYEVITTPNGLSFITTVDVPSESTYDLTIAADEDTSDPEINLHLPQNYDEMTSPNAIIEVTDTGWGVMEVEAFYKSETITNWTPIELTQSPEIGVDEWDLSITTEYFEVPLEGTGEISVRVEAKDYAGNTAMVEQSTTPTPETPEYTLTINSEPVNVEVLINGNPKNTPYTEDLPEGPYTIEVPPSTTQGGTNYIFQEWGDGEMETSMTITLDEDTALNIIYVEDVEETPPEEEEPSGGIPIPATYIIIGLAASIGILYLKREHTPPILTK